MAIRKHSRQRADHLLTLVSDFGHGVTPGARLTKRFGKVYRRSKKNEDLLPNDVLDIIFARVVSSSFEYLFNAKLRDESKVGIQGHGTLMDICDLRFLEPTNYEFIYKFVSVDKFPVSHLVQPSDKVVYFLTRCFKKENDEALFRHGMWPKIVGFNLEGAVAEWFQWMMRNGLITTWARFEESLRNCFGPSEYEDPNGVLSKLLQLGTVKDYQRDFEKQMNRATDIPGSLLISFYISGLKLHLQRGLLASKPLTLGYVFLLARTMEARFEDNRPTTTIVKPNNLIQVQHLEETTFHKSNKVEETEARVEATVHKEKATTEKEDTIKETADTLTSLQSEVEKLPMELQLKKNFREALETTSKDMEKMMLDLNPTLHDLQKVIVDQKKKHYKTKHALNLVDEEFKKVKSEATTKIKKLVKVYGAWLPPWFAARLVVYQPYVKNH
ncbi:hypothetical protein Tco_0551939 [Tanacetum coccineum]